MDSFLKQSYVVNVIIKKPSKGFFFYNHRITFEKGECNEIFRFRSYFSNN